MESLSIENLRFYHDSVTIFMILIWILFSFLGLYIKSNDTKRIISFILIAFALSQEFLDYTNRFFLDSEYVLSWRVDLPLQFCHFGFYFSIFLIYSQLLTKRLNKKVENFIFDCTYVLGFGGAFQSLLNFDATGVHNLVGAISLNLQHSLIILNVLWLIFAYNKRFSFKGVVNAFLFINFIILPIGLINYLIDSNYMFLCKPPNVDSSFFIGKWPYYIFWLELIYFIYTLFLLLPFQVIKFRK